MWPTLFDIGGFQIGTFGLFVVFGFIAAYRVGVPRAVAAGLPEDRFINFMVVTLILSMLGAKLLFVLVYMGQAPVRDLFFSRSGLVFYGGLVSGIIAGSVLAWKNGWDLGTVADVIAPMLPLGQFFGRIGCLLNGCCYGGVCPDGFPFGIRFPRIVEDDRIVGGEAYYHQYMQRLVDSSDAYSLPVYPTQIFSALAGLVTFLLLTYFFSKRVTFKGQLALIYLLIYSVFRFCVEMFRDDPRSPWGENTLSTSQVISIGLVFLAIALWKPLKARSEKRLTNTGDVSS